MDFKAEVPFSLSNLFLSEECCAIIEARKSSWEMKMLVVIANMERNQKTGRMETIVSHGVDMDTLQNVILPQESPESLGAKFDPDLGEWVIRD